MATSKRSFSTAAATDSSKSHDDDTSSDDDAWRGALPKRASPLTEEDAQWLFGTTAAARALGLAAINLRRTDWAPLGRDACMRLAGELVAAAERARTDNGRRPDWSQSLPSDIWALVASHCDCWTRWALRTTCTRVRNALHRHATRLKIIEVPREYPQQVEYFMNVLARVIGKKPYIRIAIHGHSYIYPQAFALLVDRLPRGTRHFRIAPDCTVTDWHNMREPYEGKTFQAEPFCFVLERSEMDIQIGFRPNFEVYSDNGQPYDLIARPNQVTTLRVANGSTLGALIDKFCSSSFPYAFRALALNCLDLRHSASSRRVFSGASPFFDTSRQGVLSELAPQIDRFHRCTYVKIDTGEQLDALGQVTHVPILEDWQHNGRLSITVRILTADIKHDALDPILQQIASHPAALRFATVVVRAVSRGPQTRRYQMWTKSRSEAAVDDS